MRPDDVGKTIVVLDDLITSANSKIEAIDLFEAEGLVVKDVVVLVDREQGGKEELAKRGITLHAALTQRPMLAHLRDSGNITSAQYEEVIAYLDAQKLPPQS